MVQIRPISVFAAALLACVTSANISVKDIDSLRSITKDFNEKIRALKSSHNGNPVQAVILNDQNSKDDIEDVGIFAVAFNVRHLWLIDKIGRRRLFDVSRWRVTQSVEYPHEGYINRET